jgi:hypothetical protein
MVDHSPISTTFRAVANVGIPSPPPTVAQMCQACCALNTDRKYRLGLNFPDSAYHATLNEDGSTHAELLPLDLTEIPIVNNTASNEPRAGGESDTRELDNRKIGVS